MSSTRLHEWLAYVQAFGPLITGLATAVIAAVVGTIAYRQWKTASAKLALDLFDKRMAVYMEASEAIRLVTAHASARENEAWPRSLSAWRAATFLFQQDLRDHLEHLVDKIAALRATEEAIEAPESEDDRQAAVKRKWALVGEIVEFRIGLPDHFAPYMRMDHKI